MPGYSSTPRRNNTSGHPGVTWDRKAHKWTAQIYRNRRRKYLGRHENKDDAIAAYKAALAKILETSWSAEKQSFRPAGPLNPVR